MPSKAIRELQLYPAFKSNFITVFLSIITDFSILLFYIQSHL